MTQEDVDRIENEKTLAKLRAEQEKAQAAAKKAQDEKLAEPIDLSGTVDEAPKVAPETGGDDEKPEENTDQKSSPDEPPAAE